ncbi:MAG: hypothetical protein WCY48_03980 [Candidatus Caldatribacteriota bacterium]
MNSLKNMQILIVNILSKLPASLVLLPYHLANFIVVTMASLLQLKCWARNSYYFKNIVPGLSDIDFTLFIPSSSPESTLQLFLTSYKDLKKIIPILGEVNIYKEKELPLIEKLINSYELKRDPLLTQNYLRSKKADDLEKIVYMLRMIESDFKSITQRSHLRRKKWTFHFKEIGLTPPENFDLRSIINSLDTLTQEFILSSQLETILSKMAKGHISLIYDEATTIEQMKPIILLYPHRWLVYSNGLNQTEHYLEQIEFNTSEENLILSHIRWELFGLITQRHNLSKESNLSNYLEMIIKFLDKIKGPHQESREALIQMVKDLQLLMINDFSDSKNLSSLPAL